MIVKCVLRYEDAPQGVVQQTVYWVTATQTAQQHDIDCV